MPTYKPDGVPGHCQHFTGAKCPYLFAEVGSYTTSRLAVVFGR